MLSVLLELQAPEKVAALAQKAQEPPWLQAPPVSLQLPNLDVVTQYEGSSFQQHTSDIQFDQLPLRVDRAPLHSNLRPPQRDPRSEPNVTLDSSISRTLARYYMSYCEHTNDEQPMHALSQGPV